MSNARVEQQQYDSFDANVYLNEFCAGKLGFYANLLSAFVELFSQFADGSIEMLDVGGGPSVIPLIASARKTSRYIHADYASTNRTAVKRWWKNDPEGFNWKENIRFFLKLEGRSGTDQEATEREELMRRVLDDVVHCDVLAGQGVPPGFEGPYDVVSCLSCLDCVCTSAELLGEAIRRLSGLVKSGGYLILQATTTRTGHSVSEEEQKRVDEGVGEVVHTKVGYVPSAKEIGGFKYSGFLYEGISTYVKFVECCGFTVVKQFEYVYDDPSIKYTDHLGVVIGKKQ